MSRSWTILLPVLLLGLAPACAAGPGNPEKEYRAAMQALYQGDLVGFYKRLVPSSYDRDLNSLLSETREIFSQQEFEQARRLLTSFGNQVADRLQAQTDDPPPPLAGLLAQSLGDIPSQMGMGSYEQFQQATVKSILKSLQQAPLGEALRDPSLPVSWSRQRVELVEQSEDRARLRVTSEEESASSQEEEFVDLVLVDGKWVPSRLAAQWDERISQLRSALGSVKSQKQSDPQYISNRLTQLGLRLEALSLLITDILESLARQAPGN